MSDRIEMIIAHKLNEARTAIIRRTADWLAAALPMNGLDEHAADRAAQHHERMMATARRFHELLQGALTIDWNILVHEYAWAARVISRMGFNWEHQCVLFDAYVGSAAEEAEWTPTERMELEQLAQQLRITLEPVYVP
jgi:hypothetical protein